MDFGGWQADGGEWNPGTDERESFAENLAVCDEAVLETYLETGEIGREEIIRMTAGRKLFPVFFGSALKMKGIESFLRGLFEIVRVRREALLLVPKSIKYPETARETV